MHSKVAVLLVAYRLLLEVPTSLVHGELHFHKQKNFLLLVAVPANQFVEILPDLLENGLMPLLIMKKFLSAFANTPQTLYQNHAPAFATGSTSPSDHVSHSPPQEGDLPPQKRLKARQIWWHHPL